MPCSFRLALNKLLETGRMYGDVAEESQSFFVVVPSSHYSGIDRIRTRNGNPPSMSPPCCIPPYSELHAVLENTHTYAAVEAQITRSHSSKQEYETLGFAASCTAKPTFMRVCPCLILIARAAHVQRCSNAVSGSTPLLRLRGGSWAWVPCEHCWQSSAG